MANWDDFVQDILYVIAQKSTFIEDLITFSTVCKSWSSSASSLLSNKPPLPTKSIWLMLSEEKNKEDRNIRRFFNLFTGNIHKFELPHVVGRRCVGAYKGWLITLGRDLQISLLHPFSLQQIPLPSLLKYRRQMRYCERVQPEDVIGIYIRKMVFSSDPLMKKDSCVVMTVYGDISILGYARPGDQQWTDVKVDLGCYDDIIFYRDKFYAVRCSGFLYVCNLDADGGLTAEKLSIPNMDTRRLKICQQHCSPVIAPKPIEIRDQIQKYLVESSGDLLLVQRIHAGILFEPDSDDDDSENDGGNKEGKNCIVTEENCERRRRYYTVGFKVMKLEKCSEKEEENNHYSYKWTNVDSLGDKALFLSSSSTSVSVKDYDDGCVKANCIYFTDDNPELYMLEAGGPGRDMGVYDMQSGTIQPHFKGDSLCHLLLAPPTWII